MVGCIVEEHNKVNELYFNYNVTAHNHLSLQNNFIICQNSSILVHVSLDVTSTDSVSQDYMPYMLWQFPTNVTG